MSENPKAVMPARYKFFIRMFLATFCAWAIPHIAYRLMQLAAGPISITFDLNSLLSIALGLALVSGFGLGFVMSIMQWIALRPYIRSFWLWMISQELVWIAGDILGLAIIVNRSISTPESLYEAEYTHSTMLRLASVGAFTGLLIGILQQIFLQKRTGIRIWWGAAALFAVLGGTVLNGANVAASWRYVSIDPIYSSIVSGLVFASIASLPALLLKDRAAPDREALVGQAAQ